jgi:hypothetical protein
VDGSYVTTISTYAAKAQPRMLVWHKHWATPTSHTIKLVNVGTSGHPRLDVVEIPQLYPCRDDVVCLTPERAGARV